MCKKTNQVFLQKKENFESNIGPDLTEDGEILVGPYLTDG